MQLPFLMEDVLSLNHDAEEEPLKSVYANDPAVANILPLFINNIPKYLENLRSHILEGDWQAAARVCHDLKGTAGRGARARSGSKRRQIAGKPAAPARRSEPLGATGKIGAAGERRAAFLN
jgi:hypothetical protein